MDLYSFTLDPSYLSRALLLQSIQDQLFLDSENGGYFISALDPKSSMPSNGPILTRMKDSQDGAEPAATSVSCHNLTRLISLLDQDDPQNSTPSSTDLLTLRENLIQSILSGGMVLSRLPHALGTMVSSLLEYHSNELSSRPQILMIGTKEELQPFLEVVRRRFGASQSVLGLLIDGNDEKMKDNALYRRNGMVRSVVDDLVKRQKEGFQVHICQNFTCASPLKSVKELEQALREI